ncbi:hypothetical protein [Nocardioides cynanchi]|uniref:hypothetical protein n=1 Tax=Nocardioides cynanchi TaxID=2558918 RepID=UPI001247E3FD|nr:hypothetical protein [Nocardioides cynanchi]
MPTDGRRFVLLSLFVLAVVGVLASTLWAWFWAGFDLDTRPLARQEHLDQALAAALGAGLLALSAIPMRLLRVPHEIVVLVSLVVALLGVVATLQVIGAADAPRRSVDDSGWALTAQQFWIAPTGWPMALFVVLTPLVRTRAFRARRPARGESA